MNHLKYHVFRYCLLFAILFLGVFFRLYNLNWDQNFHLHPDERFLTMVGNAMKLPHSIGEYFNPATSLFNPANIGFSFYVYGVLPIILNQLISLVLNHANYTDFTLQGRMLSAIADIIIIFLVYKSAQLFEKRYELPHRFPYVAAFFYTIAILPIQLSHFFTVDMFLTIFAFASFYFACRFALYHSWFNLLLSAVFLGFSLASKISAVFITPCILLITQLSFLTLKERKLPFIPSQNISRLRGKIVLIGYMLFSIIFFLGTVYLTLRITDPYLFTDSNFLNPRISPLFMQNIESLKSWEGPNVWFPPAIQWINKPPVMFSLINLIFFGIGPVYFIFLLIGIGTVLLKPKRVILFVSVLWIGAFFLYQSVQFVKAMRYFILLYPFFALFAGLGFSICLRGVHKGIIAVLGMLLLVYPFAYFSIYTRPNTRVAASVWMYENIPDNAIILWEHWDDPLPLLLEENYGKTFNLEQLPVFDQDTPEKWVKIRDLLEKADYLVLSSNRGWGSITSVPQKYPLMSRFYKDLLSEKLQYKIVQDFTSYPSLHYLGIPFTLPDDWADESFTVYDHPRVIIFQKQ